MGTDDTQVIRIEPGEKIGAFKPECVYNLVRVTSTQDWRRTGGGRMPKSGVVK